ncbi:MAG: hypothetical protein K0R57_1128 [Paenibacillaceae bacterium]|jgi:hypothetical protein|nr:hypothetical protein [Paenibacillaceae bacterium]
MQEREPILSKLEGQKGYCMQEPIFTDRTYMPLCGAEELEAKEQGRTRVELTEKISAISG